MAGPVNKTTIKKVSIANTVKYGGKAWKVVQVNANAFKGCKKLTSLTINGSNIKKIEKQAFAQCSKLKTVNLKKATGITSIGKNAFQKISAKAKITVPKKKYSKFKKWLKTGGIPKKATIKK